jgi:hypothetical protein
LTLEPQWLERAVAVADQMIERFHDREYGGFFTTDPAHDLLIMPVKSYQDRAMPSGNGAAVQFLAALSTALTVDDPTRSQRYAQLAAETLDSCWGILQRAPTAGDSLLYGYLQLEGETLEMPDLSMPTPDTEGDEEEAGPVHVEIVPMPEGLLVVFEIEEGWHINSSRPQAERVPTTVEVTTDLPLRLGAPIWSPPQQIQAGSAVIEGYTGMAQAIVPVLEIGDGERVGRLRADFRALPALHGHRVRLARRARLPDAAQPAPAVGCALTRFFGVLKRPLQRWAEAPLPHSISPAPASRREGDSRG